MFQPERTHDERIYLSVSWQRPDGTIPRGNAEIHAEMARLVQGVGRKGPHHIPWTSARTRRQGRQGEAEERPRWALCRGQGHRQRLHSDRGEGPSSRGRTLQGLSDLGSGRVRGSAPDPHPGYVMEPSDHLFRREAGRMVATLTRVFGVHNLALAEDVVASAETAVRAELCHEAMRLAALLLVHPHGATPASYALSALMCLNAARLPARVNVAGNLTSLFEQDRSLWDGKLAAEGIRLLELAATGTELTEYHLEAAIASVHARAPQAEDTDWAAIVSLYDLLMSVRPSPVVALNHAIAIAQHEGPERGLEVIGAIEDRDRLADYPFYPAALGELELRRGRHNAARKHFRAALALARNPMERQFFKQRVGACERGDPPEPAILEPEIGRASCRECAKV